MAETATFRAGSGDPLVLLHIGANPWRKWEDVIPALAERYDVFMPTYAGFQGGPALHGPATIDVMADAVEAEMDAAEIGRAHIAGNSLGGWIAMELARRGRARSAIAISPGGGWNTRWRRTYVRLFFRANRILNWVSAPAKPLIFRSPLLRRIMLRGAIERGDLVTREQALALAGDTLKVSCPFRQFASLFGELVRPYPDPGVPTLLAWAEKDRLTPLHPDGDVWRAAAPHAEWRVLPGLGHLPMFDDPDAVTDLVLDFLEKVP